MISILSRDGSLIERKSAVLLLAWLEVNRFKIFRDAVIQPDLVLYFCMWKRNAQVSAMDHFSKYVEESALSGPVSGIES